MNDNTTNATRYERAANYRPNDYEYIPNIMNDTTTIWQDNWQIGFRILYNPKTKKMLFLHTNEGMWNDGHYQGCDYENVAPDGKIYMFINADPSTVSNDQFDIVSFEMEYEVGTNNGSNN